MAIIHDVIPLPVTGTDIYGPAELLAQSHAVDSGGLVFNDTTVQTTAFPGVGVHDQVEVVTPTSWRPVYWQRVGTAYIGGDQSGDPRGDRSLDIQTARSAGTAVASGADTICIGQDNTGSGTGAFLFGLGNSCTTASTFAIGTSNVVQNSQDVVIGSGNASNFNSTTANFILGANNSLDATVVSGPNVLLGFSNGVVDITAIPVGSSTLIGSSNFAFGGIGGTCVGQNNLIASDAAAHFGTALGDTAFADFTPGTYTGVVTVGVDGVAAGTGVRCYLRFSPATGEATLRGAALVPAVADTITLGKLTFGYQSLFLGNGTNTTAGASATINKSTGRFRVSAGTTAFTLTNSRIAAGDTVLCQPCQADLTGRVNSVVPAGGSAVINLTAPTANMDCQFLVIKKE
jgi:hypothetical protein